MNLSVGTLAAVLVAVIALPIALCFLCCALGGLGAVLDDSTDGYDPAPTSTEISSR